jgi:hypothetical protein
MGMPTSRLAIEQPDAPPIDQKWGNGAATRSLRLAAIQEFMR